MVSSLWSLIVVLFGVTAFALPAAQDEHVHFTTTFRWSYPTPSAKVATFGPQDWTTFVVSRTNAAGDLYPQTVTAPRNRPTAISPSVVPAVQDAADNQGGSLDVAAIVCLVVFPVAAAAIAGFLLCYLVRRRKLAASTKDGADNATVPDLPKDGKAQQDDASTLCGDDSKSEVHSV